MPRVHTSWKPGQSGNPAGKPKGTTHKRITLRALLEPHSETLIQKAVDLALSGDTTALRLCLERLISPMKSRDEPVRLDKFGDTLAVQGRTVLKAMATGEITPNEAATLMQSISAQARVVEVEDLAFKKYNDTHGHDAGDFVLVEISDLLRSKLREGDIACRYGGEELVMVMPGATKEITAARAEFMREAIEKHDFVYNGSTVLGVTVSLDVANYPADGDSSAKLMKAADSALYQAKDAGRNRGGASLSEGGLPRLQGISHISPGQITLRSIQYILLI